MTVVSPWRVFQCSLMLHSTTRGTSAGPSVTASGNAAQMSSVAASNAIFIVHTVQQRVGRSGRGNLVRANVLTMSKNRQKPTFRDLLLPHGPLQHAVTKMFLGVTASYEIFAVMQAMPHLLVVDDDREICALLSNFLAKHGFRVSIAHDGRTMTQALETARISLVVLDLMLPGEDGLSLCRRLRTTSTLPVIMLTAIGEETDRIIGLEMGADDYLAKPFNPRELLARVRAVLRRTGAEPPASGRGRALEFAGWRIDVARRQLFSSTGALIPLRAGEFDLLLALAERPQRVLTRDQLLDLSRGRAATSFDRSVDVQISRLRAKIETNPKDPDLIKTVRSGGYIFAAAVTVS
jgi:two-component system, OmpR family, response regulator